MILPRLSEEPDDSKELTRSFARDHGLTDPEFSDHVRRMRGTVREEEIFGPPAKEWRRPYSA